MNYTGSSSDNSCMLRTGINGQFVLSISCNPKIKITIELILKLLKLQLLHNNNNHIVFNPMSILTQIVLDIERQVH